MSKQNGDSGDVLRSSDPTVRPLMYGYLRLDLLTGADVSLCEAQLETFAGEHGYEFGAVFRESSPQTCAVPQAFADLVHECRRAEAGVVVTLAGHMSGMAISRMCLLDFLASRGHAHLVELPT
ncbi:hypothetical protein AB0M45_23345 [Nocardia sp. NPDC051787]|uniref:hypothetical protein n=1 Tax=Nocardia sp. NPDC051787 TaxID=3155415 RepID=UPI003449684E